MKCIHCSTDSKYSERTNGRCPSCRHAFAFEPKKGDKLTDRAFQVAIERVSSFGTVKWTAHHLYYEVARHLQRKRRAAPWVFGIIAAVALLLGTVAWGVCFLPAALFGLLAIAFVPRKLTQLKRGDFDAMWSKWLAAHGPPKGLIVRKAAPSPAAQARSIPDDIQHYSFDRAVVTDRVETADLLLANNFHFENNCAIFTGGGYPAEAFETVRAMLRNNPKLTVYVIHDATIEGCLLAGVLRARGWFLPTARIVDVGLRPEHAQPFKGCWQRAPAPPEKPGPLPQPDADWLARYAIELAVIRPEQIIKRLFRALSNQPIDSDADADGDGDGWLVDSSSFGSDASASDGGGDSFG